MRVRFSSEIMRDAASWRTLDRMVMHFEDGRHDWLADNALDIEASEWLRDAGRSGGSNRKALQEHIRMAVYPKKRLELTVTLATTSEKHLCASDALRAMETPLYIAMENATADGGFLVTVILALNHQTLWEAWEKRWMHLEQMGGFGEAEKTIVRLRQNIHGPCRIFVLADSDARFPGEETATVKKVKESCANTGASYAILTKRKIENYLPACVLSGLSDTRGKVAYRAFKKLTASQQSYFEMKDGFKCDEMGNVIIPNEQGTLFSGVDYHACRGLLGGFGKDISERFVTERNRISEADIRQACDGDPTELDRILDAIERLL